MDKMLVSVIWLSFQPFFLKKKYIYHACSGAIIKRINAVCTNQYV